MLIKQETWITPLEEARTLHLYIPDMLTEGQKVPVLYMFDGTICFWMRKRPMEKAGA